MVPIGVYIAVEYSRGGLHADLQSVWPPYLQRTLATCDDLDCTAMW